MNDAIIFEYSHKMALSNTSKDVATRLFESLLPSDSLASIKGDHSAYAKLTLLAKQMKLLQEQAEQVLHESQLNADLKALPTNAGRVPGRVYHLYTQNDTKVLSIIAPNEWQQYDQHHGAFLYDFDHTFKSVDNDSISQSLQDTRGSTQSSLVTP